MESAMTLLRRLMIWSVPAVLVAALAWSLMPRGGTSTLGAPAMPPVPAVHPAADAPTGQAAAPPSADTLATGEIRAGNLVSRDASGHKRWQIVADDLSLARNGTQVHLRNVH